MTVQPLLVVDVDGVLNRKVTCQGAESCRSGGNWQHSNVHEFGRDYTLHLNPAHGPMLRAFAARHGAQLMWGTSWGDAANTWVGPRIGLPRMPFLPIPVHHSDMTPLPNGMWKVMHAAPWLAVHGRPFAWLDDEHDVLSQALATADVPMPAHRVIRVNPVRGLRPRHLAKVSGWLAGL